jgi:hypothetical protein
MRAAVESFPPEKAKTQRAFGRNSNASRVFPIASRIGSLFEIIKKRFNLI